MLEIYSSRQNQKAIELEITGLEYYAIKPGENPVLCWSVSTRASDRIRGFIPYTEAGTDIPAEDEKTARRTMLGYLGQKVHGIVYAINRESGYFVASRKQAMERFAERTWKYIEEGAKITVTIRRTGMAKAVGECGGVRVEIPRAEVSHSWVEHTSQILKPGEQVEAVVKKIEPGVKIIASIKDLQPDPWQEAGRKYQKGGIYTARVTGVVTYGIFVELEPGVSALCYHLKYGQVGSGDTVAVQIQKINPAEKKINGRILQIISRRQAI